MSINPRENHIDYVEFPAQPAEAFAAVKRFYKEVFGWSFQDWGDDYSDTKDSGTTSGFSAASDHRPAGTLVVLFTSDLEAGRERVINAGGKIVKELFFPAVAGLNTSIRREIGLEFGQTSKSTLSRFAQPERSNIFPLAELGLVDFTRIASRRPNQNETKQHWLLSGL